jgi:Ca2+-binding RTX toxin-like protein
MGRRSVAKIVGTEKSERLDGTSENDKIHGLDGDDQIYGGAGDDLLVGGDGNDRISDTLGSDTIDAGAGNDQYDGWRGRSLGAPETVTVSMGDGDDYARFASPRGGVATFDMGAGNDTLVLIEGTSATTVTLGEGSDSIGFSYTIVRRRRRCW